MINSNYSQHNNITFGSQFKATDSLKSLFYYVKSGEYSRQERYEIARSLNSISNDGKNDIIEFVENVQRDKSSYCMKPHIIAKVNGNNEVVQCIPHPRPWFYSSTIYDVLIKLAQKLNPKLDFNSLSERDIKIVEPEMKKLTDLIQNNKDVPTKLLEKTNKLLETMNEKLGMKAMDDLCNLGTKIFGKV